MGALEIRNKKLRCINCLDIRRLLIIPGYPDPKIEIMCHCNKSEEYLLEYCSELKKITDFKLVCTKCGKEEIKHPRFCYECLAVYCSKCCNNHLPRRTGDEESFKRSSLQGHKTIHVEKLDFYCVNHQTENFIGYCQQCLMNICPQCIKEETHQYHQVELYSVIKMDKKTKEEVKKGLKKVERKIERSSKKIKAFCKKNKKIINVKDMEEEFKVCQEENEYILELIKYCYNLYDHSKNKNYSIIYNLIKNSKFNYKKLKIDKNLSIEEKAEFIQKYLKKDFFILYKRSKTNVEEFEVDNEEEQEEEDDEKDEEKDDNTNYTSQVITMNFSKGKISEQKQEENYDKINNELENNDDIQYSSPQQEEENQEYEEPQQPQMIMPTNKNISTQPKAEMQKIRMPIMFNPQQDKKTNPPPHMPMPGPKKLKMPSMFEKKEEKPPEKPLPAMAKLKMPLMFEKKEEEKPLEKPLPAMAKLKMPLMFEKKEEDNKPKERAPVIQIGAKGNLGDKKNALAQMMANKGGMPGKPKIPAAEAVDNSQPAEEKIEIVHESNEAGTTAEVLNKVAVSTKKKKKPRKAKAFSDGDENQEKPKPPSAPIENTNLQENNNEQEKSKESEAQQENIGPQIEEELKVNENENNE